MAGNFSGWSRLQHGWSVKYTVKAQKDKSEDTYTFGRRSQHAVDIRGGRYMATFMSQIFTSSYISVRP